MNNIRSTFYLFFILFIGLSIASCSDDNTKPGPDPKGDESVNQWIYEIMDDHYLWYNEMPRKSTLDFSAEPKKFFNALLNNNDGKSGYYYSRIEETENSTRNISASVSYGYEYILYSVTENDPKRYIRILYTFPGSPAEEAGLKRGMFISRVNGTQLTVNNYYELINSKLEAEYTLAEYTKEGYQDTEKITIKNARNIEENPFLLDTVYEKGGKRIAYLIYNNFSLGKDENDTNDRTYLDEMVTVFHRLKTQTPDEFILDMRYNPGGYVICAQWLASMLVPQSNWGNLFVYTKYNDKHPNRTEYKFIDTGVNLNMPKVYVIGTRHTASASEAVIHGLKPYMDIIQVGETTEGKNVGSVTYTSDDYPWKLHPIVCRLYNAEDNSNYANGIDPTHEPINEFQYANWYDLGDTRDILLSYTLDKITGKSYRAATLINHSYISDYLKVEPSGIHNSIKERKIKGNIIFQE